MNIPLGTRRLVVGLQRVAPQFPAEQAMIEASDREIEQLARSQNKVQEPRWDVQPALYGWHT